MGIYSQIWGLDPGFTFQRIRNLFLLNYFEPIDYLSDMPALNDDDKTLLHRWECNDSQDTYTLISQEDTYKLQYLLAKGIYERAMPKTSAFIDEDGEILLPRDRRIFESESKVIFFEKDNRLYSIVYGSRSSASIRTILMGSGFKQRRRPEWGTVDNKLAQFRLDSDFFYWMFFRYQMKKPIQTHFGAVAIDDIEGIGRYSAKKQHDTKSKGPNCINEISHKSALGINQLVYETSITFTMPNIQIIVCLSGFSEAIVDFGRSVSINPSNGQFDTVDEVSTLLKLYLEIIPGLIGAYNSDRSRGRWTTTASTLAKKRWALDVIEELANHHSLSKNDLLGLKCFAG
jgi:hypothetical protein